MPLKILFVYSGNRPHGISSLVQRQLESLRGQGIEVDSFLIQGRGIYGYLKNLPRFCRTLKNAPFDLIHAHYAWCGLFASLGPAFPLVVSLMGSDANSQGLLKWLIRLLARIRWQGVVVKSERMKLVSGLKKAVVIPNGVSLDMFYCLDKSKAKSQLNFASDRRHILFVGNPQRQSKNFSLAQEAVSFLGRQDTELHVISQVSHEQMPVYLSAGDVLLLTSRWEGSPNVVKEALSCNLPVVATDVGDIRELLEGTAGCHVTTFDPADVASHLQAALDFTGQTNGRQAMARLDEKVIAQTMIAYYRQILQDHQLPTRKLAQD